MRLAAWLAESGAVWPAPMLRHAPVPLSCATTLRSYIPRGLQTRCCRTVFGSLEQHRQSGDTKLYAVTAAGQRLVKPAGLINVATTQLAQGHHAHPGFIADQDH